MVHDLFEESVLDLSWTQVKDQTILLACSTDGTIAALLLSEDELGISLSAEEKVHFFFIIRWLLTFEIPSRFFCHRIQYFNVSMAKVLISI